MVRVHLGLSPSQAQQKCCPPAQVPGLQAFRDAVPAPAHSLCMPHRAAVGNAPTSQREVVDDLSLQSAHVVKTAVERVPLLLQALTRHA